MASDPGSALLQDDGSLTLDENGQVLLSDGTSDCDCCGPNPPTVYCVQVEQFKATCNDDGTVTYAQVFQSLERWSQGEVDAWAGKFDVFLRDNSGNPLLGTICEDQYHWHIYGSTTGVAPCLTSPITVPPPTSAYPCKVCLAVDYENTTTSWSTINSTNCPSTTTNNSFPYHYAAMLCGHLPTDWVACTITDPVGGIPPMSALTALNPVVLYQPSTGHIKLNIPNRQSSGDMTATASPCAPANPTCSYDVTLGTPINLEWRWYAPRICAVGTYSACIGRTITVSDVCGTMATEDWTVTVTGAACGTTKYCYYTKQATCTQVSPYPLPNGTWVWIPGTVTAACLASPPGLLDTWSLVSGRTYQVIRKSGTCLTDGDCTNITTETPLGVIACP